MDPDLTLPYVAATLKKSIDAYRTIAGFDISQNPGITATLYNVGNPEARAYALKAENEQRLQRRAAEPPAGRKLLWLAGQREAAGTAGAVLRSARIASLSAPRDLSCSMSRSISSSSSCADPLPPAGWRARSPPATGPTCRSPRADATSRRAARSSSASSQMTLK